MGFLRPMAWCGGTPQHPTVLVVHLCTTQIDMQTLIMYICKPQANVGNYVALAMIPWRKSWEEERELLVINSYEVFNELERFSWWMIYPLPPLLLSSKCYLVFLQLVPQLEALFTFAFVFNKSLTFPYLLFNLSLFALS